MDTQAAADSVGQATQLLLFTLEAGGYYTELCTMPHRRLSPLEKAYKCLYVRDLLYGLGYENVEGRSDDDCFEAAAIEGFVWNGNGWVPEE